MNTSKTSVREYRMAMDIGGTFLDTIVVDDAGTVTTTKVLATHDNYASCISSAVNNISEKLSLSARTFLRQCRLAINGTTVATNVLAQLKGPPVGLIATRGTADTLYMARILRWASPDNSQLKPLPQIVLKHRIRELDERIAKGGRVVVPLDEAQAENLVRALVEEEKIEALAVSLLWSFVNPRHEQQVKAAAHRLYPKLPVSISSEVFPSIREYERTNTTVIDAFITPAVVRYIDELVSYFDHMGFEGDLRIVHAAGGVATPEEIKRAPVSLINSGPAAGYVGAVKYGAQTGRRNIITADVGGTSFDAGLIHNGQAAIRHRTTVHATDHDSPGYVTGLSLMDVTAIGVGGGSIGWIDSRGMVRVGPKSAGSDPGPVCFGKGGTEPTLTDACLILGMLAVDTFLGGKFRLNYEAAAEAIRTKIAKPMNLPDEFEAAAAIYRIACADMASNVRRVSVEKGHDPRDFSLFSYGGAGGLFLADVCRLAAVPEMLAPPNCAVFSAFGALVSDYKRSAVRACAWHEGENIGAIRDAFEELRESLLKDAESARLPLENLVIEREADMRFLGQNSEITTSLPIGTIDETYPERLIKAFHAAYQQLYGADAVWMATQVQVVNIRAIATIPGSILSAPETTTRGESRNSLKAERRIFWPGSRTWGVWPIHDRAALQSGVKIDGPLVIESEDTTVVVPPQTRMEIDAHHNIVVSISAKGLGT